VIEIFDLRSGAKTSETKIKEICMEQSEGNTKLGVFACVLTNKVLIYSLVSGELLSTFENLRIRDLAFGDISQFIYFGGFGDDYFGPNSRGGYGVILSNYYSNLSPVNDTNSKKETGKSLNFTLEGKVEFIDNCKSYDLFKTKCDTCSTGLTFSKASHSCKIISNATSELTLGPDYSNIIFLNPDHYETDISENSPWYFTLKFLNLKSTTPLEKQQFIQSIVDKKQIEFYMWKVVTNIRNRIVYHRFKPKFTLVKNHGALWSEGKLLVKMSRKNSDISSTILRISAPDYTKRILSGEERILIQKKFKRVDPDNLPRPQFDGTSKFLVLPSYLEAPGIA
jgi:hypothetical protein